MDKSKNNMDKLIEVPVPKKTESILESLLQTLTCPVCLETLRKDCVLCVNGHAICRECRGNQYCCPTCREKFSNLKKNVIVQQVLEVISGACRFEGCGYLVNAGEDHEIHCAFRPVTCGVQDCKWSGLAVKLVAHIKTEHPGKWLSEMEEWFGSLSI